MNYSVFCDESYTGSDSGRYMLIGSLWLPSKEVNEFRDNIKTFLNRLQMTAELKWTKLEPGRLNNYKSFVDIFFNTAYLEFRCIVIDKFLLRHDKWNDGDEELGFYKFYYLLLENNIQFPNRYKFYLDERTNKNINRLPDLIKCLNNAARKKASNGCDEYIPIIKLEAKNSKKERIIQLSDILLGAIGCSWNKITKNPAKLELSEYVKSLSGLRSLDRGTERFHKPIAIWNFLMK